MDLKNIVKQNNLKKEVQKEYGKQIANDFFHMIKKHAIFAELLVLATIIGCLIVTAFTNTIASFYACALICTAIVCFFNYFNSSCDTKETVVNVAVVTFLYFGLAALFHLFCVKKGISFPSLLHFVTQHQFIFCEDCSEIFKDSFVVGIIKIFVCGFTSFVYLITNPVYNLFDTLDSNMDTARRRAIFKNIVEKPGNKELKMELLKEIPSWIECIPDPDEDMVQLVNDVYEKRNISKVVKLEDLKK